MLKWIFGGILLLIGIAAFGGFRAYKKFTAGGGEASIAIAASPERVFASLANADSLSSWMVRRGTVTSPRKGALEPGDEITVETKSEGKSRAANYSWTVKEVRAPSLLVMEMRGDSRNRMLAERRDSIFVRGDSTIVHSSIAAPMFDSLATAKHDSSKFASAMVGFGGKMFIAAFRTVAAGELARLKTRIEGKKVEQ